MKPTIGRVVLFFCPEVFERKGGQPYPASITHVHGDSSVNLAVDDDGGVCLSDTHPTSVLLLAEGEKQPESGCWCEWPIVPKGQAGKGDDGKLADRVKALEEQLAALDKALESKPAKK